VRPHITFGVELRWLRDPFHAGDFREHTGEQPGVVEKFEPLTRGAFGENLSKFVANAFSGDLQDLFRERLDGRKRRTVNGITEACREADGTHHAQFVFSKAEHGIADRTNDPGAQILAAADKIEDFVRAGIHQERINGEITAADVVFGTPGILDAIGMAAVGVANVRTKRRDFDPGGVVSYNHNAELRADCQAAREEALDLVWSCVRRNVKIGGLAAEQEIAHASTDEIGLVAVLAQNTTNATCEFARIHRAIMSRKVGGAKLVIRKRH